MFVPQIQPASSCTARLTCSPSQPLAPPDLSDPTSCGRAKRTSPDRSASRSPCRPWHPTCASRPRGSGDACLAPTPRCSVPPAPPDQSVRSPRARASASPPTPAMPECPRRQGWCRSLSRGEESDWITGLWEDHGLVFTTHVGTPMSRQDLITRSFKPLLQRAKLPNIRFHDLRHTCATLLLGRGVHAKLVQELLGHATISVTLDTYSHVLPSMTDQTASAMEDVLS